MNFDFVSLHKVGVGCVLVRHSEIVELEPTHHEFTRIELSTGNYLIVEQGPIEILNLIDNLDRLKQLEEDNKNSSNTTYGGSPGS